MTGVTVCRKEVLEDGAMAEAVKIFMKEHKESAEFANNNAEETARLVAEAGIIRKPRLPKRPFPTAASCV